MVNLEHVFYKTIQEDDTIVQNRKSFLVTAENFDGNSSANTTIKKPQNSTATTQPDKSATQTTRPSVTETQLNNRGISAVTADTEDDFLRGFNADDREAQVRFQTHPYTPPKTTSQAAPPSAEYKSLKPLNNRGIMQVTADDFLRGPNKGYEDELPTQTSADVRRLASFDDDYRHGFWSDYGDAYKSMVTMNEAQREFEWLQKYLVPGNVQFYDFEEYARKGAEIQNPSMSEAEGYGNFFGWHPGAEEVGNIVTFSRDNWEAIADAEMDRREVPGRSLYHYMTEDEVDIYNYLIAKRGSELAQLYLDSLEEMLNQRYGTTVAGRITDIENPVGNATMTGLYGVSAGLDQYVNGVKQAFSEEELPTSATQYGSQYIRNDLQQDGNGLGLMAYDTVTTASQMAPTILVSAIFGPEAGAVSQGVSATGNAYKQALSDGYSKDQAENYAMLVGTSEAALQYALGGISKLGGVSTEQLLTKVAGIDNAIWRVAAAAGIKIGSEVTEEELQLFLEPLYRTLVFGEDYSAPATEEILYTALLTAIKEGEIVGTQRTRAIYEVMYEGKLHRVAISISSNGNRFRWRGGSGGSNGTAGVAAGGNHHGANGIYRRNDLRQRKDQHGDRGRKRLSGNAE